MTAPKPAIKEVSIKHEAIMDFIMANPTMRLQDVATFFNMSNGWLSQIIHSDAFQARLAEKKDVAFHHTVLPLREKMTLVAHQALDQLADKMPMEMEPKKLADIATSVLDRLGFGTKTQAPGGGNTTNVSVTIGAGVLRDEIEAARALIGKAPRPLLEVDIDGTRFPLALSSESEAPLGLPGEHSPFQADVIEEAEFSERSAI